MTGEASVERFARSCERKSDWDCRFSPPRLDVALAGAMATLAAGLVRRRFAGCNALVMWISEEVLPDIGMAGLANGATYEAAGLSGGYCIGQWLR